MTWREKNQAHLERYSEKMARPWSGWFWKIWCILTTPAIGKEIKR